MSVICKHCNVVFDTDVKFCSQCGQSIIKAANKKSIQHLNTIISFYVAMLLFIVLVYYIDVNYPFSFEADLVVEISFALIVLAFALLDIKAIIKLYTFKTISLKLIGFSIIVPLITSFIVYFSIEFIGYLFSVEETINYYEAYLYLDYPLFWSIMFIAVAPPIIEELAFRGVLYNKLKEVTNTRLTIIATAFLFALIHFSLLSFIWIFPFGLLLGYLRSRYNTLWLGIIIHFIHNFTILMLDYYSFYSA